MRPSLKMRLGYLLVHEQMITEAQLSEALNVQAASGRKLGATLIALEFISEPQLLRFLAQQLQIPFLDISQRKISSDVSKLLSEVYARRYRALVIEANGILC